MIEKKGDVLGLLKEYEIGLTNPLSNFETFIYTTLLKYSSRLALLADGWNSNSPGTE